MIQTIIGLMFLVGLGFVFGVESAKVRTTLPDYEMAVGLCVVNDGVDFMTINREVNNDDYMDLVTCNNGAEFKSKFHWRLEDLDIKHVYIKPRTPRLNGKVERSHRIDGQEFYQLLDKDGVSDDIHLYNEKLREWEDYYNYHRPHGAFRGKTPYEILLKKLG